MNSSISSLLFHRYSLKLRCLICCLALAGSCTNTGSTGARAEHQAMQAQFLIEFPASTIIERANEFLTQPPVPITQFTCERSTGGLHDFYSEGDYWWPNPEDPDGPYIRKDGQTNPENFTAHRKAMRNLNQWVATLVAAYQITKDEKYAAHAIKHLQAFFLNPETLMNPNLLYAQAIKGKVTGRGIGIIDTIHLIEITQAIERLIALGYLKEEEAVVLGLKKWYTAYAHWLNTHPYGLDEKDHGNNHSTWWAAQVAAFAHFTGQDDLLQVAREQFKKLLSEQMAPDGSFPDEIKRTKPYNYSLFNLEGYAVLCQIASTPQEDLWRFEGKHGSLQKAWQFMLPYIQDKSTWVKPPDVQHFDELPTQSPGFLFAALAYEDQGMLEAWKQIEPKPESQEIKRTYPIREASLWVEP